MPISVTVFLFSCLLQSGLKRVEVVVIAFLLKTILLFIYLEVVICAAAAAAAAFAAIARYSNIF